MSPESRPSTSFTFFSSSSESRRMLSPEVASGVNVAIPLESSFETPRKRKLKRHLESARKKIKYLQQKTRRLKKSLNTLQDVIKHLQKKNLIDDSGMDILSNINVTSKELFIRQAAKVGKKKMKKTYSPVLKKFALTLNFYSPKAYQYVREVFNTCLPHVRTIAKWYSSINGKPGLTCESFTALRLRQILKGDKQLLCNLTFDEMAIRKHVETNGKEFFGFVDMGEGCENENLPLARQALTFLVTAINENWKLPIGYFFIDSVTAEQKENLLLNSYLIVKF